MTDQGADERRIRTLLVSMGVGPAATQPTPTPPEPEPTPAEDPSDTWWDDLYADDTTPGRRSSPRLPDWWRDKPEHLPGQPTDTAPDTGLPPAVSDTDTPLTSTPPASTPPPAPPGTPPAHPPAHPPAQPPAQRHTPPQSLIDAYARIPARTRWLAYHATAAAAGWYLGLVTWATHTAAWYAAGHWTTPSAWALYTIGLATIALYRRTRTRTWPIAWATAIPVSSLAAGLLLYGTGA